VAKGTIEEGMLSVLAFKRSLSAGILDGGSGEISLGGSRLSRFMEEVETVTGRMGESEAVTPAEELSHAIVAADETVIADAVTAVADNGEGGVARPNGAAAPQSEAAPDPWQALVQMGAQFAAALASSNDPEAPAHPWIERDPATGARSLKMPLPSPQVARQLADALTALATGLRSAL